MFQTITKLYASTDTDKGRYIYFGATTIYCDEKNVCSVYYPDSTATVTTAATTIISSA